MKTNNQLFSFVIFLSSLILALPASAKDVEEVEPNDVAPTALDNHDRGLGAISPAITDTDEWSLHGGSVGDLVYFAIYSEASGNPDTNLTAYNNDGFSVLEFDDDDAIGKQSAIAGAVLAQPGKVFFSIHDETNNQAIDSYQVCGVVADPVLDGANESESNDDAASADDYSATIMFGDLADGTADFYQFTATAGTPVMVIADDDPGDDGILTDTNIDLLDTDGSSTLSGGDDDVGHNANATKIIELPSDGTYYVRITGGGANTDYSFVICGVPQPSASVGDFVWDDRANKNGIQDAGEPGINGLKVYLIDAGDLNTTDDDQEVDVTTTGPHPDNVSLPDDEKIFGWYEFAGLHDGNYQIRFEEPTDIDFTLMDQGGDDGADSDADELNNGKAPPFTISNHADNFSFDAGLIDEVQPEPPGANIGDKVFADQNGNGIDDGEPGIAGVMVNLLDPNDGFNQLATTTTNINGAYAFTNLDAALTYVVEFILPAGKAFTAKGAGMDDSVDSDADPISGRSDNIDLNPGETVATVDAGMTDIPGSIGDFVWDDTNENGLQDLDEPGIEGVSVSLLDNTGEPMVPPRTVMTDADGAYEFDDLTPGTYHVQFGPVDGFLRTEANKGGDESIDSDANEITGITLPITVGPADTVDTVDAGYFKPLIPPCMPGPDLTCDMSHEKARYIQKGIFKSAAKFAKGTIPQEALIDGEFLSLCVWFDDVLAIQSSALADDPGYFTKPGKVKYKNKNNPLGIFKAGMKAAKPGKSNSKIVVKTVVAPAIPDTVEKVDIQAFNANGCWGQTLTDVKVIKNSLGQSVKLKARTQ